MSGMRAAALLLDRSFRADVLLAGDDSLPEPVRVGALECLADRFPRPIHPRRWPPVHEALTRLSQNPTERERLLRERVMAAAVEITEVLAPTIAPELFGADVPPLFTPHEALAWFRTRLGSVVQADILGDVASPPKDPAPDGMDDLVLAERFTDVVAAWIAALRPEATERERELLDLLDRNPMATREDAAATLGCEPSTIGVMCSHLKRKAAGAA